MKRTTLRNSGHIAYLFAVLLSALAHGQSGHSIDIRVPASLPGTEDQYAYFTGVLKLAIRHAEHEFGGATLQVAPTAMFQQRQLRSLEQRQFDVIWSVTDTAREKQYHAVYFPVIAGLYGYRVLLQSDNRPLISAQSSLDDIRNLLAVQGQDWPDFDTLRRNGFKVSASDYAGGFALLSTGFVDYYPRGVTEVSHELAAHQGLQVAPGQVLYYPNPVYFFVHPSQGELAQRIESGLAKAWADGSLFALLSSQAFFVKAQTLLSGARVHVLSGNLSNSSSRVADHPFVLQVRNLMVNRDEAEVSSPR